MILLIERIKIITLIKRIPTIVLIRVAEIMGANHSESSKKKSLGMLREIFSEFI